LFLKIKNKYMAVGYLYAHITTIPTYIVIIRYDITRSDAGVDNNHMRGEKNN